MSDFSTVIVSYDDCVSLGMSIPQAVSPLIAVPMTTAHINELLFLMLFIIYNFIVLTIQTETSGKYTHFPEIIHPFWEKNHIYLIKKRKIGATWARYTDCW